MHRVVTSFILLFTSFKTFSQDERDFRDFLKGVKVEDKFKMEQSSYKFKVRGPRYFIDINSNHKDESFFFSKKDGEDWMFIKDYKGREIFKTKFITKGPYSRAFRIKFRQLSEKSKVLIIYFYEGASKYFEFNGAVRAYFLTIDNNNLETLSLYPGPQLFIEKRSLQDHYFKRKYELSLFDFNKDGVREVASRYGHITRLYKYSIGGRWSTSD